MRRSHSHLVQQYAMNRSKIDQRMNQNLDMHLYLYCRFKLRHQNDTIGYFV